MFKIHYRLQNPDLKQLFSSKMWLLIQYSTPNYIYEISIPLHILGLISTQSPELISAVLMQALRLELKSTPKGVDFHSNHLRE